MNRGLWLAFLISFLLHLAGVYFIGSVWREALEADAFRARLSFQARFEPRRITGARPRQMLQPNLEFLRTPAVPADAEEFTRLVRPPTPVAAPVPTRTLREDRIGAKQDTLDLARVEMPPPSELAWTGASERTESLDLLRIEDLRRAGDLRAVIVQHPTSRRHLTGFLSLRQLRVYGAGSVFSLTPDDASASLEALARYMRDNTKLMVEIGPGTARSFTSSELLKDPMHFLVEGAGTPAYLHDRLVHFDSEEKKLLNRYLHGGGFLLVEGGYPYLTAMVSALKDILHGEGFLYPLPASHPIYHSFYEFDSGFPSEVMDAKSVALQDTSWYYPGRWLVGQVSRHPPLGLWGLELNGELAAVISDLWIYSFWRTTDEPPQAAEGDPDDDAQSTSAENAEFYLQAGTNILVYTLTRSRGLTAKRDVPTWERVRESDPTPSQSQMATPLALEGTETEGMDLLDASLGLLRSPLGSTIEAGGMSISVDGARHEVDPGTHGVIVHNLSPGMHDLEIQYGDKIRKLEVRLSGGMVRTLTFGLLELIVVTRLRVQEQDDLVDINSWLESFSDLAIEEKFTSGDVPLPSSAF